MKEFIENLIDRLEEESYLVKPRGRSTTDYGDTVVDIGDAIDIVNQLAEEFDGEELRKSQKIYSFIKREINPYGKPFEGTVYEFGLKVMKFIKNIHTEEFAPDINVVSNNGWIPCGEKLPKENIQVIVTAEKGGHRYTTDAYFYNGKFYNKHYYKIPVGELNDSSVGDNVLAWMPLPAPYKEGCE